MICGNRILGAWEWDAENQLLGISVRTGFWELNTGNWILGMGYLGVGYLGVGCLGVGYLGVGYLGVGCFGVGCFWYRLAHRLRR